MTNEARKGGESVNRLCQHLIMFAALGIIFFAMGITSVAAQGPDNPASTSQAEVEGASPTEVLTTQVDDTSFTVSWKTQAAVAGWVEYGTSLDKLDGVAFDDRGQDVVDTQHHVTVKGLELGTGYYFIIVSGGEEYDNASYPFKVLTGREANLTEWPEKAPETLEAAHPMGIAAPEDELYATPAPLPQDLSELREVKVTRIEGEPTSFMVKWKTAMSVKGWIEYGPGADNLDQVAHDARGEDAIDTTHWVLIKGMKPDTEYFFVIVADGERHDSDGALFQMHVPAFGEGEAIAEPVAESESGAAPSTEPTPTPGATTATSEASPDGSTLDPFPTGSDEESASSHELPLDPTARFEALTTSFPASHTTDFIRSVAGYAQAEDRDSGVPASFSIAQAAWESAWGRSSLASVYNNYHGISCSGPDEGLQCVWLRASDGRMRSWNRYSSAANGFLWHGRWLRGNSNYRNAFNYQDDPIAFAREVLRCYTGCGNFPQAYFSFIVDTINRYNLRQYDDSGGGGGRPPAAPSNLRATPIDPTHIGLTWNDNSNNESGFKIYDGAILVATVGANTTSYTVWGLAPNSYHCYHIYAYNNYGNSAWTDWGCARTPSGGGGGSCLAESPHPYSNNYNHTWTLTNPDGNATSTRIHFSRLETESGWDYVYVRDGNNNQIYRYSGNYPSGGWTGTVPGRTVRVQLTTDGSVTRWGFCADRIETVSTGGQPPAAPSNLRATATDSTHIRLTWNDNSNNESGFKIYDGGVQVATVGANTTSYTVGGLSPNSYHCYHIYAYNNYGNSAWTDWGCARTPSGGGGTCSGDALGFEQTAGGWLSNFIPRENYCFTASAGQWASIRMFAYNNTSLDTYIKLYAPDGRLFAQDDDGAGTGYNSFLVRQLPQSGTYRLEATRFGSTSGDYRLRLEGGREAAVGDIDRNCMINARDDSLLQGRIGSGNQDADLNLDGIVNTIDLSILRSNIGRSCP